MSMVLGLSQAHDKSRRKSCHRRNDDHSGQLDVFDAEGYFSAINETTLFHEIGMSIRDDCHSASNRPQGWREGRVSLDIPAMRYTGNHFHHHHYHHYYHRQHSVSQPKGTLFDNTVNPTETKERKHRQPSSPGGKLASFFTSLIRQKVSNKKKYSKSSTQIPANKDVVVEEVQSPSHGWRRGSSKTNSLFSSSTTTSTTASTRSRTTATATTTATSTDVDHIRTKQARSLSGLSGIRTSPPPCAINTPTKSYKDFRCKNSTKGSSAKSNAASNLDWLDEKFKSIGGLSDKQSNKGFDRQSQGSSEKERVSWVGRNSTSEESSGFKRFMEDDGGETDSSSDLFELQLNYECSSGLPVYETTCMDTIKRSSATPTITNV